jgi:hypothetical protein
LGAQDHRGTVRALGRGRLRGLGSLAASLR